MSKKILVVTGDAGEGYECWYAFHRFLEEGMKPVIASTKARRLQMVDKLNLILQKRISASSKYAFFI